MVRQFISNTPPETWDGGRNEILISVLPLTFTSFVRSSCSAQYGKSRTKTLAAGTEKIRVQTHSEILLPNYGIITPVSGEFRILIDGTGY
jgi:hypothetical protein